MPWYENLVRHSTVHVVPVWHDSQMQRTTETQSGTTIPPSDLLDYEGAAEILGCSPRLVRKLVETRKIESVKVASLVRLEREAIGRYIDRNRRVAI